MDQVRESLRTLRCAFRPRPTLVIMRSSPRALKSKNRRRRRRQKPTQFPEQDDITVEDLLRRVHGAKIRRKSLESNPQLGVRPLPVFHVWGSKSAAAPRRRVPRPFFFSALQIYLIYNYIIIYNYVLFLNLFLGDLKLNLGSNRHLK
jgi:hypothetical protein